MSTASFAGAAGLSARLVVIAEETPRPRVLLASPDTRSLLASVLAVVEREAGWQSTQVNRGQPQPCATTHGGASLAKHGVIAISGRVTRGAKQGEIGLCGGWGREGESFS